MYTYTRSLVVSYKLQQIRKLAADMVSMLRP